MITTSDIEGPDRPRKMNIGIVRITYEALEKLLGMESGMHITSVHDQSIDGREIVTMKVRWHRTRDDRLFNVLLVDGGEVPAAPEHWLSAIEMMDSRVIEEGTIGE